MCSMLSNSCPSSSIAGYQFQNFHDCVDAGYAIAQKTYRNLKELEDWDKQHINKNKLVVKFECKEIGATT